MDFDEGPNNGDRGVVQQLASLAVLSLILHEALEEPLQIYALSLAPATKVNHSG